MLKHVGLRVVAYNLLSIGYRVKCGTPGIRYCLIELQNEVYEETTLCENHISPMFIILFPKSRVMSVKEASDDT